jgi:hypothetical protein
MRRFVSLLVVVLLLGLIAIPAQAKKGGTDRPFKGNAVGEAVFDLSNSKGCPGDDIGFGITTLTEAAGNASHLGKVKLNASHCPLLNTNLSNGDLKLVAANGDELYGTYTGTSTPIPGNPGDPIFATLQIEFDGGTGRFADAKGYAELRAELVFEGFADLAWPWKATWKGKLSY